MPEDPEQSDDYTDANWRRALEEKARRADDLEAQLAEVKRQAAFNEAGITSANPAYKYFTKAYEGEMTPEAIRAEAEAAGFLQPATPPTPSGPDPAVAEHARTQAASQGTTPPPTTDLLEGINQAQTADEVMALMSSHTDPRTGQAFRTTWNQQ